VVFARPFISNPDFTLRIAQDKEIDMRSVEKKDQGTWYGHPDGHQEAGYSDYVAITTSA
jgi:2,4-dienoyl-CoA reductase-like NADH-dependent reductase (Old Yellow Enzyme family)